MSVYESGITNPKKQLEFYKDLSEQLQQENKQLKVNCNIGNENLNFYRQKNIQLKEVIEEVRKYIKEHIIATETEDILLQILDKAKGEDNE